MTATWDSRMHGWRCAATRPREIAMPRWRVRRESSRSRPIMDKRENSRRNFDPTAGDAERAEAATIFEYPGSQQRVGEKA